MHFRIVIASPPGWGHADIFAELAETLCLGFRALGYRSSIGTEFDAMSTNIVMAAFNLTPGSLDQLPRKTIIYNLEQFEGAFFDHMPVLREAFRRFEVWDYSVRNMTHLKEFAPRLFHLPIGTMPQMTRIVSAPDPDIDVLFYGTVTDRRQRMLRRIAETGLNLKTVFGVYGSDRDELIARSKVVLNLHQHEAHVFEIARVSYLLANRKAVVTEKSPHTDIDPGLEAAVCGVPYEELPNACVAVVSDEAMRHALEQSAFQHMATRNQAYYLRKLLNERQRRLRQRVRA